MCTMLCAAVFICKKGNIFRKLHSCSSFVCEEIFNTLCIFGLLRKTLRCKTAGGGGADNRQAQTSRNCIYPMTKYYQTILKYLYFIHQNISNSFGLSISYCFWFCGSWKKHFQQKYKVWYIVLFNFYIGIKLLFPTNPIVTFLFPFHYLYDKVDRR